MRTFLTILIITLSMSAFCKGTDTMNVQTDSIVCLPMNKVLPATSIAFVLFYKVASIGFPPLKTMIFKKEDTVEL